MRTPLFLKTVAWSVLGFGVSWWFIAPRGVAWKVIGKSEVIVPGRCPGGLPWMTSRCRDARVMFHPRGRQYRSAEGRTDSDGHYELQFCEGLAGAPPGRYRVQLQLIEQDGGDAGEASRMTGCARSRLRSPPAEERSTLRSRRRRSSPRRF